MIKSYVRNVWSNQKINKKNAYKIHCLFDPSELWDYTVLSHFQCFPTKTPILDIKVIAHDSDFKYIS
jgi:hypothetical protein